MPRPLGAVERLGIDRGENAVRQVVAEVPADPGRGVDDAKAVPLELLRRPDPREQEQPRRVDRARGEHHLLGRVGLLLVPGSAQEVGDAPSQAALDEQPRGARAREHRQVGPVQGRAQVAVDDAEAAAATDRDRREPRALVVRAVEVGRAGDPRGGRGLEEVLREGARPPLDGPWEVRVAPGVCAGDVVPAPAGRPGVVVGAIPADRHHRVDRGRPAEHLAAREDDPPSVERVLRDGVVAPVERRPEQLRERRRDADVQLPVARACLEQEHARVRVLGQPCREHAAGGTRTDDHDVVHAARHRNAPAVAYRRPCAW